MNETLHTPDSIRDPRQQVYHHLTLSGRIEMFQVEVYDETDWVPAHNKDGILITSPGETMARHLLMDARERLPEKHFRLIALLKE
jgi:hypothetical protein